MIKAKDYTPGSKIKSKECGLHSLSGIIFLSFSFLTLFLAAALCVYLFCFISIVFLNYRTIKVTSLFYRFFKY